MRGNWTEAAACGALFLALGASWAAVVPPAEAPDEAFHLMYAAFLAREARRPVMRPPEVIEVPVEGNQPPLYYVAGAVVLRLAGKSNLAFPVPPRNPRSTKVGGVEAAVYDHGAPGFPWDAVGAGTRLLRFAFLPFGLIVILAVHRAAARVWPADGVRPLLAAGFVATLPQFTFIMGSVTNDVLANALAAAALALVVDMAVSGRASWRQVLALSLVTGLGIMTKMTLLFLLPLGVAALWIHPDPWRGGLRKTAVFVATAVAVASPVFLGYLADTGDPFGIQLLRRMFPQRVHSPGIAYFTGTFPAAIFFSFWGVFGHMNVHLGGLYWLFALLTAATLMGLALRRDARIWTEEEKRAGVVVAIALAGVLAGIVQHNRSFMQPQGRYTFPGLVAFALVVARGLGGWAWGRRPVALGLVAALALLNIGILAAVVAPAYAQ